MKIKKMLSSTASDFQDIAVFDTDEYGRCLVIDGVMQTAETDHSVYDRELLKLLQTSDRKILILGGGDGYVAEMALKLNESLDIKVVDIDVEVVQAAEHFLGQKIFHHEHVDLYVEDVFRFLEFTVREINGHFDGIVCDLTDVPLGRKEQEGFEKFYNSIVSFSKDILKPEGWISVQGGASEVTSDFIDSAKILEHILKKNFSDVARSDVFIPSYGESCAFLFGKNG
ncbi:MAG: methyltransferase [Patescibacteria group bacterium]